MTSKLQYKTCRQSILAITIPIMCICVLAAIAVHNWDAIWAGIKSAFGGF